jgi:hypothetical protein
MTWDPTNDLDRAILKTARSWGVSPSVLMGKVPVTTLIPVETGGFTVHRESDWTQEDIQAAISLTTYESNACPGCGDQLSETTDPDNQFQYVADLPIRCHKCTAIHSKSEALNNSARPGDVISALFITAHKKDGGEKADDGSEVEQRTG